MHRRILFVVLCLGVIARSLPAQDYVRSQYRTVGRSTDLIDNRGRYDNFEDCDSTQMERRLDTQRRYRPDSSTNKYTSNVDARDRYHSPRRETPARTVTFYRDADRYATNRDDDVRYDDVRYDKVRYPEDRYRSAREYPVRQTNYSQTRHDVRQMTDPRPTYRAPQNYYHPPRSGYPQVRPPVNPQQYGYPSCHHGPATPRGTYVGDGIIGQPVLYTQGQPIRNLVRSIGL